MIPESLLTISGPIGYLTLSLWEGQEVEVIGYFVSSIATMGQTLEMCHLRVGGLVVLVGDVPQGVGVGIPPASV